MTESFPYEAQAYIREMGLSMETFHQRLPGPLLFFARFHYAQAKAKRGLRGFWQK